MAIWYWDPVGGNNANDGTTFANRKLNLQNLTSVAAGDTVRCIKSPDAVNTGINATWTDGSNTVTLASAVTQLITSCDTNWTAATNVTCATSTVRKEGTNSVSIAVGAAFTTGKAAYFPTGTLNCSGYQQITFWIKQTAGTTVAGDISISLCSDTLGATPVNTFAIPAFTPAGVWFPLTIDLATNLGASIQSIAFYVNVDRGAVTYQFDNINVALALASTGAITCTSLIGKGGTDTQYLGIRSINGTTVILDSAPQYTLDLAGTEPTWSGTTETVALYRRETLKTAYASTLTTVVNSYGGATGTVGNIITISGGWDTTNMSTQTGQTYLDGTSGYGYGLQPNTSLAFNYMSLSNINCCRYNIGLFLNANGNITSTTITADNFNNNALSGVTENIVINSCTVNIGNLNKNGYNSTNGTGYLGTGNTHRQNSFTIGNCNSNWMTGVELLASSVGWMNNTINITNANRNNLYGMWIQAAVSNTINITNCKFNSPVSSAYYQFFLDGVSSTGINSNANSHDNIINLGTMSQSGASSGFGFVFGVGSENNKLNVANAFSGFTSTGFGCLGAANSGSNFVVSTAAVIGTQSVVIGGSSRLYISTADTTLPTFGSTTGSTGQIVLKNAYGYSGQSYTYPNNSWGLT